MCRRVKGLLKVVFGLVVGFVAAILAGFIVGALSSSPSPAGASVGGPLVMMLLGVVFGFFGYKAGTKLFRSIFMD